MPNPQASVRATVQAISGACASVAALLMLGLALAPDAAFAAKLTERELLSGQALFDAPIEHSELPDVDILALTDQMRDFVHRHTSDTRDTGLALRRLLSGMLMEGLLSLNYEANMTKTAAETFREREGNCIAFTTMFVALAREAGIDVSYQMVDIPPVWLGTSDLVILNKHINVVAKLARRDYVIDFNEINYKGNYDRRAVSDDYALALYHSNLAVDALQRKETRTAFLNLVKAIRSYPKIPGPWVNLGVLFARNGKYEHAEAAYEAALDRDRRNMSALTNLARLHKYRGDIERSEEYFAKVKRYQRKNPYYVHWLAKQAYAEERYEDSMQLVRRAIKLKKDEHQFHYLQGVLHYERGDEDEAAKSFARAREHAIYDELKRKYNSKLAALAEND